MSLRLVTIIAFLLLAAPAVGAGQDSGQTPGQPPGQTSLPDLVAMAAINQGHSLFVRDRCRYEQRLLMERYKFDKKTQQQGELVAKRQTTVVVEPEGKPDETGGIPVTVRVVADTNDKGEPKDKVDPDSRTGLASGAFLDQIFFPLLPEKIKFLVFDELPTERVGERRIKFTPKTDVPVDPTMTLASGTADVDSRTGEVLTVHIDGLANLKAIDKHLDKILSISAAVDYSQFAGEYRLPTAANGTGVSDVSRFQGYFKFVFEEGKYVPVMKLD
jgi:hypothetical protein